MSKADPTEKQQNQLIEIKIDVKSQRWYFNYFSNKRNMMSRYLLNYLITQIINMEPGGDEQKYHKIG